MALRRYTKSIDGTIPVVALLYQDEELLASQDNVGIYDGLQKAPNHQSGTVHVSSHRLFYIDARSKHSRSFALDLSHVTRTEYYAGLFKSSPKVTLHLTPGAPPPDQRTGSDDAEDGFGSWVCEVCGYRNPPGLSPAAAGICTLCGVPRSALAQVTVDKTRPPPTASLLPRHHSHALAHQHLSSSLPSSAYPSGYNTPAKVSQTPSPSTSSTLAPANPDGSISCTACTFLNHPSLFACEICGTALPRPHHASQGMKSAPTSRPASPDASDDDDDDGDKPLVIIMKLSFRKGGDKAFYAVLKRSLQAKAWEVKGNDKRGTSSADQSLGTNTATVARSGIHGILQGVETSAQNKGSGMQEALQDLEALMVKAKDMVRLAEELNERLTASASASPASAPLHEPEEATFIRSSLSQLGLRLPNAPVTQDMIKDERQWLAELARELAGVLQGDGRRHAGMMKDRGVVALDEVWGGWNRARGVALVPPSTFLLVLPHLPLYTTPPVQLRAFPSGLSVLHTPPYTHAAFTARLVSRLALAGPLTTLEAAQEEEMTAALAAEMIDAVEGDGHVCRDDGVGAAIKGRLSGAAVEVRWWANVFKTYVWDGQEGG